MCDQSVSHQSRDPQRKTYSNLTRRKRPLLDRNRFARLLPAAACEVGELDRCGAFCDGDLADRSRSAPGGGVVDVHVGDESFAYALDEAVAHYVIHPAVAAKLTCSVAHLLPQIMLVLRLILVDILPLMVRFCRFEIDTRGIVAIDAFRSLDEVDAVVGPRACDIVLDHYRPA